MHFYNRQELYLYTENNRKTDTIYD
jgi:hypothetical protein